MNSFYNFLTEAVDWDRTWATYGPKILSRIKNRSDALVPSRNHPWLVVDPKYLLTTTDAEKEQPVCT